MQSRETVDIHLSKYLASLKRHKWLGLGIFAATVAASVLMTTLVKPSYVAEGKLIFKVPPRIVGANLLGGTDNDGNLKSVVSSQNPINTEIEVIFSPAILQKVLDDLQLTDDQGELLKTEDLQRSLSLRIIGGTDVLSLTYQSKDPEAAAAVVNKLMNVYIQNDILTSRSEAKETRQFIAKELPQNEAAVRKAELALREFKEKNKVVNLSQESNSAIELMTNLDSQIANVRSDLDQVIAQRNALSNQVALNEEQALNVILLSQSPAVQGIMAQLQEIERELATEGSRFQNENPSIILLEEQKTNLDSLLQAQIEQTIGSQISVSQGLLQIGELKQNLIRDFLEAEVQRLSLAKKLDSLYGSRKIYENRIEIIPQLKEKENQLEQAVELAQFTYQALLKQFQELQLSANKNTAIARIIVHALVPEKSSSGAKLFIVIIGFLLGIFLSITTILLLEMRDRSLKTIQEVREIFGYTLLGIIPLVGKKARPHNRDVESKIPEIPVRDTPHSLTSEMYRMIQANLRFLSSDKVLKTIVVTSAVPQEGKSTVSANLAAAIAQLGRRVLLIDADMRVPSQHHIWQLTNAAGLSEVLVGEAEFKTAACKVMDDLDILTAGVRPPNPLALLDSKRMASLINNFSAEYDFVILDAPPMLIAADALTVSQMTDGIILVARTGVIDSSSAHAAQEMLERSGHNVLGLLVNGVSEKNESIINPYHAKEYVHVEELAK